MNVIIYWETGGYADVYNVDEVKVPTANQPYLRTFKKFKGQEFETARFKDSEISGWQIFLTAEDVKDD